MGTDLFPAIYCNEELQTQIRGHFGGGMRDIRQGPEKWAVKKNNKERRTQKTATRGYRRKEQEIR